MTQVVPRYSQGDLSGLPRRGGTGQLPRDRQPDAGGTSPEDQSAHAILIGFLNQYGLGGLANTVWNWWKQGHPLEQIMLDIRQTPQYKARFPAMDALAKRGQAVSEAEYVAYEKQVAQTYRQAGLPSGFYDRPDDFTKLLVAGVSVNEVATRVAQYQNIAFQSSPTVRSELERLYGVTPGELTAFFIDPERALPLIQQRSAAATAAGAAKESGFGLLTQQEAENLAMRGVDAQAAQQGFGKLVEQSQVFQALPGSGESQIGREEQLAATFGGDAQAALDIARRQRARAATFQAGGSYATGQDGTTGLGVANS